MNKLTVVLNGPPNCVDAETEYLSPLGWKKIKDYSGEKILVYSEDGSSKYEDPLQYISSHSEVEMNEFSSNKANMVLTDNHRIIYKTGKSGRLREKTANAFYNILSKNTYGFDGKIPATFFVNSEEYPISDAELRFIVMLSAGGTEVYPKTGLTRIRVKHQYKKDRAVKLLSDMNLDYAELYDNEYTIFRFYTKISKGLPYFFYSLSDRQLKIVKDELVFWDGDCKSTYRTTKKEEADIAQFVFASQKLLSIIREDNRVGQPYSNGQYIRKSICYEVAHTNKQREAFGMQKLKINKTFGIPYCFTTSTGMWVARRNNKIFITGNSGKDYITDHLIKHLAISGVTTEELMFKTGLYKETARQYFMPEEDFIRIASDRTSKDMPNERLGGVSPRDALIDVSENFIKPFLGNDYFAKELLENIKDKDVYIISDGGFKEETQALIDSPKINKLLLIHLHAPGCSFEGDSRSYIHYSELQNFSSKLTIELMFNSKTDDICVIEILYLIHKLLYQWK